MHGARAAYRVVGARGRRLRRGRVWWRGLDVEGTTSGPQILPTTLPRVWTISGARFALHDDVFLVLFNAHHEPLTWTLPIRTWPLEWVVELDTTTGDGRPEVPGPQEAGRTIELAARSVLVLHSAEAPPGSSGSPDPS